MSDRDAVFKMAEKVKKEVGEVSILVNNAGIMPTKPLLKQTPEEIDRQFKINVYAHFWVHICILRFDYTTMFIYIHFIIFILDSSSFLTKYD